MIVLFDSLRNCKRCNKENLILIFNSKKKFKVALQFLSELNNIFLWMT